MEQILPENSDVLESSATSVPETFKWVNSLQFPTVWRETWQLWIKGQLQRGP